MTVAGLWGLRAYMGSCALRDLSGEGVAAMETAPIVFQFRVLGFRACFRV